MVARPKSSDHSQRPSIPSNPSAPLVGLRYRILKQLGHGGFGRTYLAEDEQRFKEYCVLKEFAPRVEESDALLKAESLFEREAGVLYRLRHPQIPPFRELLRADFEGRDRLFLVQDYVDGSTYQDELERRIQHGKRFAEPEILQFLSQILPVLDYIHGMGVIHRDISPDNLILRDHDQCPVLIDFGGVKQAATTIESELRRAQHPAQDVTLVGKQGFAPREQMQDGHVFAHCDLYALAVTVLVMMTGQSPRDLLDPDSAAGWKSQLPDRGKMGPLLTSVLSRMLSDRPANRYPSARHVMDALGLLRLSTESSPLQSTEATQAVGNSATRQPNGAQSTPQSPPLPNSSPVEKAPPHQSPPTAHTVAVSPAKSASSTQAPPASPPVPQPVQPTPSSAPRQRNNLGQGTLAFLVILILAGMGGWVGYQWIPQWLNIGDERETSDQPPDQAIDSGQDLDDASAQISPEEQARKDALRSRRAALGIDTSFLVALTDTGFYETYPRQRGRQLTDSPEDAIWRERWDAIATDWLDLLDEILSPQARLKLGRYGQADRDQWKQRINRLYISSPALYDVVDAEFIHIFPDQRNQNFIDQPIGQIWHGLAADQVQAMQSGTTLKNIQFADGATSHEISGELAPGDGQVYTLNLAENQQFRLTVDAPQNDVRLSIYVPQPTDDIPAILEDARSLNWSGTLPQSGYYEVTIVSVAKQPSRFRMMISVE
ncbi:MAG: serine/threonine-protein kinase [Cyanobacteria bacterium P01_A01_bin.37]